MGKNKQLINPSKGMQLPKDTVERLKSKLAERHDDLILDYMEQIQEHKKAIETLTQKINDLVSLDDLQNAKK